MAIRERIEVGEVGAINGGASLQVKLVRVVEDVTRAGVREITREGWRTTVDREMPAEGAPEGGWAPPMERLDQALTSMPDGWPALDKGGKAHIRRMAEAAWEG